MRPAVIADTPGLRRPAPRPRPRRSRPAASPAAEEPLPVSAVGGLPRVVGVLERHEVDLALLDVRVGEADVERIREPVGPAGALAHELRAGRIPVVIVP